jgi:hypothetical protein
VENVLESRRTVIDATCASERVCSAGSCCGIAEMIGASGARAVSGFRTAGASAVREHPQNATVASSAYSGALRERESPGGAQGHAVCAAEIGDTAAISGTVH